ncbi:MAG TPA: isoprenylcysteine carboxylmethyltransferase family protein [Chthoniobacterales bacterium]|nr:isoprenylcysteine carboxylmethyltransferase family protein [Chthoniobacterales bacterium]
MPAARVACVQATKFEFEMRFWIICAIYFVGFFLSALDHVPFIVALRHLIAPSIARGSPDSDLFARIVILAGAFLVFLSAGLRTWAAAYLRTDIVHDTSQHSEALIADGPFRYTRNPLYLGNLPMAVGIGVLASRLGFVFLVAANWIFVYRLIFREEEALGQSQGESYRAYHQAVPRFWPALRPRVPSAGRQPQWGQAFAGESFVWIFGLAELSIAVSLSARVGGAVFLLAFLAYFIPLRLVRKRRARFAAANSS